MSAITGSARGIPTSDIYAGMIYWSAAYIDNESWERSLKSLYFMFKHRNCPYFYVYFRKNVAFFTVDNEQPIVIISSPTGYLATVLTQQNIKVTEEKVNNKTVVYIRNKSIEDLFVYLLNNPKDSRIVSPKVFINGTLMTYKVTFNGEIRGVTDYYKLSLEGPITQDSLLSLISVFERDQDSFSVSLELDDITLSLYDYNPTVITRFQNSYTLYSK